jgi:tRNA (5-methylaminomethyl-2-thiouridylate)-methyltransferase
MRIALLLSGGVDSSVALHLLKRRGHEAITAFYLKIWLEDELSYLGSCPWEEDLAYAREVCEAASVPLKVVSLQREYHERVVEYVLRELRAGRTPSPDIFCNQRIKFGAFLEAVPGEFDRIATGHYARVESAGGKFLLERSLDRVKDQTYFLSHLRQDQVARALFPIGEMHKRDVRALARELDLPNKDRKDSQGICFLGKIKYPDFVRHHLGVKPGPILEEGTGRVLGEHQGFWFHTVGQRQGLGLSGGPWYVVRKDIEKNIVYITHADRLAEFSRDSFCVADLNWIGEPPGKTDLLLKIRHGPSLHPCVIEPLRQGALRVRMSVADPGVAQGQFAIFYDGEVCLGGGVIEG